MLSDHLLVVLAILHPLVKKTYHNKTYINFSTANWSGFKNFAPVNAQMADLVKDHLKMAWRQHTGCYHIRSNTK